MDGFNVTRSIREHPVHCEMPIILCTALDGRADRLRGVEAGANDFISKPVDKTELRVRMTALLQMKDAQDRIMRYQAQLDEMVEVRTHDLQQAPNEVTAAQFDTVHLLAMAAESRDEQTAFHLERVALYCTVLSRALGLPEEPTDMLYHASTLHDVGKFGIPEAILFKTGALSPAERLEMQEHAKIGGNLLGHSSSPLLQAGAAIALTHHERWNGTGYPRGLAGEDIPLVGRICAIADVFDALTSVRSYKPAYTLEATRNMMCRAKGSHFDPELLDLFMEHFDEAVEIWERYQPKAE